jgi:hypothetical protein
VGFAPTQERGLPTQTYHSIELWVANKSGCDIQPTPVGDSHKEQNLRPELVMPCLPVHALMSQPLLRFCRGFSIVQGWHFDLSFLRAKSGRHSRICDSFCKDELSRSWTGDRPHGFSDQRSQSPINAGLDLCQGKGECSKGRVDPSRK